MIWFDPWRRRWPMHRQADSIGPDEIHKARKSLERSQDQFADAFGVSASTLRKWEQGQRAPSGAAKTLLKIIEREPDAVVRALAPSITLWRYSVL
jgi:putative transcriptional regulator